MSKYLRNILRVIGKKLFITLMLSAGIFTSFASATVDVTLSIRPSHKVVPARVTDLEAQTGTEIGQIELSWTVPQSPVTGTEIKGFRIRWSTNSLADLSGHTTNWWDQAGGINKDYWSVSGSEVDYTTNTFTPAATYYFAIKAVDEFDNVSDFDQKTQDGNQAAARAAWDGIPPDAITTLSALTGAVEGEITLSWLAPGDDGTDNSLEPGSLFRIEYSSWTGTVWSTNTETGDGYYVDISTSGIAPLSKSQRIITGLEAGATYFFRIWTADEVPNWSEISNGATAWAQVITDEAPPAEIDDLAAETSLQDNEILLSWTSPGDDGTVGNLTGQFPIFHSIIPGEAETSDYSDAQIIISTSGVSPGTGIQYPVTGLEGDTIYYFVIWTADEMGQWSALSNIAAGRTRDSVAPSPPTGLTAMAGDKEISLSWTANAEPDTNIYKIYKATYPVLTVSDYDCSVSTPQTTKIITGLTNFVTYYFKITAVDTSGNESSYSAVVSTVPVDMMAPENPVGIYGEISADGKTFTLHWSAVVRNVLVDEETPFDDLAGYNIYRSTSKLGPFEFVTVVSTTQTQYSAIEELTYYYAVRAFDTTGNESEMSALIDNTAQTNLWIISRSTDGVFVDAIIKIPSAFNEKLRSACDDDDVVIRASKEDGYPKGRILKNFDFTPKENISGDKVKVAFDGPLIEIKIFYYDLVAGGSSVKSLRTNAAGITDPEKELAILWFNGVEWIKLGGEVDTDKKSVGVFTSHLGKYQLRLSMVTAISDIRPIPKIFTPNNDRHNDFCEFNYMDTNGYALSGEVFDLRGRKIADMKDSVWNENAFIWDGKDLSGKFAAPGVYIWQIKGGGKVANGTVVVAR